VTMVLEESFTCVSCLHKQIPFVPFLVGVRSNYFGLRRYRPIRPIFLVVTLDILIHFIPISFSSSIRVSLRIPNARETRVETRVETQAETQVVGLNLTTYR
jgi:hypothetical protein